ncbi:MAG: hypothetical protein ACK4YP_23505, partial [Myxococcota bacterium]
MRRFGTRLALAGLLGLALPAVAVDALLRPAWAQSAPIFEGQGLVELLRPTDLVGDGGSAADLYVLALGPDGAPLSGWKVALTAEGGTVTQPEDLGKGLHRFTFTPDRVEAPGTASITLKGKLADRKSLARTWTVPVSPPRSRPVSAVAS